MKEGKSDWTCFDQNPHAGPNLLQLDDRLSRLLPFATWQDATPNRGNLTGNGGSDNHDWTDYPNGVELIQSANCRSDTDGDDWGKVGCRAIAFKPFVAQLTHEEQA